MNPKTAQEWMSLYLIMACMLIYFSDI